MPEFHRPDRKSDTTKNRRMRKTRNKLILILAVLSMFALPTTAGAQTDGGRRDIAPEPSEQPASPIYRLDDPAESYSADYGVTVAQAERRLSQITVLGEEVRRIADEVGPAVIADYRIEHLPEMHGVITVVDDALDDTQLDTLARNTPDIEFRRGAIVSLAEQEATIELWEREVLGRLQPEQLEIVASTDFDPITSELVIGLDRAASEADRSEVAELILTDHSQVSAGELAPRVRTELVDASTQDVNTQGGKPLRVTSQGNTACTSGFNAFLGPSSNKVLLSAQHCVAADPTLYYWSALLDDFDVPQNNKYADVVAFDIASPHSIDDDKFWEGSTTRTVTYFEARDNMSGDYVCHYGRTTGRSCGTVNSVSHDPRTGPGCTGFWGCKNVYIKVGGSQLRSCGGDSGGPWYRNDGTGKAVAYGVHLGRVSGSCGSSGNTLSFSSLTMIDKAFVETDGRRLFVET